ncbi:MAG: homoserine kinase [Acidobacteriota bacterium]
MDKTKSCRVFAPGSVSNVACGFDVLGFAIEEPGDEVVVSERQAPGVELREVIGDDGRLPRDAERNTASVAVRTLLEAAGSTRGVALSLYKKMPLSSGLGSSAASGVAAVYGTNQLLGLGASREELLRCAMVAEQVACGSAHADNAAPSLFGGWVLIRSSDPPDVVELPVPEGLSCAVVRPHIEVETRASRGLLGDTVPLRAAVSQWGNLGALVAGLYSGDLELIARSLVDAIAEPKRAVLVPGFREAQTAARDHGALGCSLSGSGPSVFALCASRGDAEKVTAAMAQAFERRGLTSDRHVSRVGAEGARLL